MAVTDVDTIQLIIRAAIDQYKKDLVQAEADAKSAGKKISDGIEKGAGGIGGFRKSLSGLRADLTSLAAAGLAASAAAVVLLGKAAIDTADKYAEFSQRVGASTESLSKIGFFAKQNGVEFDKFQSSVIKLAKAQGDALAGSEKQVSAFKNLGLSVSQLSKLDAAELFAEVQNRLQGVEDVTLRNKLAFDVFGKSAGGVLTLFSEGAGSLEEFGKQAEFLGVVIGSDLANQANAFNDNLDLLQAKFSGAANTVLSEVLPALNKLLESFVSSQDESGRTDQSLRAIASGFKIVAAGSVLLKNAFDVAVDGIRKIFVLLVSEFDILVAGVQTSISIIEQIASSPLEVANSIASGKDPFADLLAKRENAIAAIKESRDVELSSNDVFTQSIDDVVSSFDALFNAQTNVAEKSSDVVDGTNRQSKGFKGLASTFKDVAKEADKSIKAVRVLSLRNSNVRTLTEEYNKLKAALFPAFDLENKRAEAVEKINKFVTAGLIPENLRAEYIKRANAEIDKEVKTNEKRVSSYQAVIDSLRNEAAETNAANVGRQDAINALEIERRFRDELARAQADGEKLTEAQTKALREQIKAIVELKNKGPFNLERSLGEALDSAFSNASLSDGFNSFLSALRDGFTQAAEESDEAYRRRLLQGAVNAGNTILDAIDAGRASDGNRAGATARALNQSLAQSGSVIAQALGLVDRIAGGRLFGTDFSRQSSQTNFSLNSSGANASVTTVDSRRRSLFRGTQTRTDVQQDRQAQESITAFSRVLERIASERGARFGTVAAERVAFSFVQNFDKDNKLVSTIAAVAGRAVNAATSEQLQEFALAEQTISALQLVDESVRRLSESYRGTAEEFSDFANFADLSLQDIKDGLGLISSDDGGFEAILNITEELRLEGQTLAETYSRVIQNTTVFEDALEVLGISFNGSRQQFIKFSDELINKLGGAERAANSFGSLIEAFFDPKEIAQVRRQNAQSRLDSIGSDLGFTGQLSNSQFATLFRRVLAGEFDAQTSARIVQYGEALRDFNDAVRDSQELDLKPNEKERLREAGQALNDFVAGIGRSDFKNALADAQKNFEATNRQLFEMARAAGLAGPSIEATGAVLQTLADETSAAYRALERNVFQSLLNLYPDKEEEEKENDGSYAFLFVREATSQTEKWAEAVRKLDRFEGARQLAQNLADFFESKGLDLKAGFESIGLPITKLLEDLGVTVTDLSNPQSLSALGEASRLLGRSVEELAAAAGLDIDLSKLTAEQRATIDSAAARQDTQAQQAKDINSLQATAKEQLAELKDGNFKLQGNTEEIYVQLSALRSDFRQLTNELVAINRREVVA